MHGNAIAVAETRPVRQIVAQSGCKQHRAAGKRATAVQFDAKSHSFVRAFLSQIGRLAGDDWHTVSSQVSPAGREQILRRATIQPEEVVQRLGAAIPRPARIHDHNAPIGSRQHEGAVQTSGPGPDNHDVVTICFVRHFRLSALFRGQGEVIKSVGQFMQRAPHFSALQRQAMAGDEDVRFNRGQQHDGFAGVVPVTRVMHGRSM